MLKSEKTAIILIFRDKRVNKIKFKVSGSVNTVILGNRIPDYKYLTQIK